MRAMPRLLLAALVAAASPGVLARPVIIEPSATIENPDLASWPSFGGVTAGNGEYLLVLGSRGPGPYPDARVLRAALLFRKVAGQWQYQGVLVQTTREYDSYIFPNAFAMQGNLAVVELDGDSRVWRLTVSGWQAGPDAASITEDIELDGEGFVYSTGDCHWSAVARDPDGSGGWLSTFLPGQPRGCDDEFWGGEVDRLGNLIIIGTAYTADLEDQEMPIFERTAAGWQRRTSIVSPFGYRGFGGAVALRAHGAGTGLEAIVDTALGAYTYELPWANPTQHRIQATDVYATAVRLPRHTTIETGGDMVFMREGSADRGVNVINVYRGDYLNGYRHVAVLAAKSGIDLSARFDVTTSPDGVSVLASGGGAAYEFRLPGDFATPTPRYENFQSGNATAWAATPGSQFAVVTAGTNRVYRQSSDAGEARAVLGDTSWLDQSIEADVTPTSFNGNDRWVGLVTRYQDAQNYYYVTLRSSGTVQLRRMRAGVFTELARAPMVVTTGRGYRLRLESVGSLHRVYVNGMLMLDADDDGLMSAGHAGITMYRARADYDNVIVTPSPHITLFQNDFAYIAGGWTHTGSGQWLQSNGVFAQNSVGAEARALIGTPVEDQIVRARIRPIAYAAATGTQERWTGLIARYADDSNYYYVTLRSSSQLSLRKLVDGSPVTLASIAQPVALNSSYDLRLEAVGSQLRVYVNGQLRLQAEDGSHARGSGGLMTYKAAAHYDDYLAYQP